MYMNMIVGNKVGLTKERSRREEAIAGERTEIIFIYAGLYT